jgi:hypothetical protein
MLHEYFQANFTCSPKKKSGISFSTDDPNWVNTKANHISTKKCKKLESKPPKIPKQSTECTKETKGNRRYSNKQENDTTFSKLMNLSKDASSGAIMECVLYKSETPEGLSNLRQTERKNNNKNALRKKISRGDEILKAELDDSTKYDVTTSNPFKDNSIVRIKNELDSYLEKDENSFDLQLDEPRKSVIDNAKQDPIRVEEDKEPTVFDFKRKNHMPPKNGILKSLKEK